MIRKTRGLKKLATWILTILIVLGMVMTFSGSEAQAARDQFNVELNSELSNDSEYYIVSMDIENTGKDFTGKARLAVDFGSTSVGYDVDISIPSGSTKTYKVNVPSKARANVSVVEVQIFNQKDKKEYAEKFQSIFSKNSGDLNFGVLSNDPDAISFMDLGGSRISVNGQNYYIALNTMNAASLAEDIDSLAGLIINDYDTSTLTPETIEKIESWTDQGGILMLGSGSHAEEVISGFDEDFLGMKYSSSYTDYYDNEDETFTIASFDYYSGNYTFDSYISYSALSGSGIIVSCCIDLAEYSPEDEYMTDAINTMYQNAIANTRDIYSNNNYSNLNTYTLETLQGYMEKPAKSASVLLILLIILYTVLVGPIAYLILKAMKMREKIWLAIPALSLIFVLFVFLISLGVRVRGITVKSINVVNLDSSRSECYIFGYAPDPEKWGVKSKETHDFANVMDSYSYGGAESIDMAIKQESDGEDITFYPDSAFNTRCAILCSKDSGHGDFKVDAVEIDADSLNDDDDEDYDYYSSSTNSGIIDGTIENNTGMDFDFVLIVTQAGAQLEENVRNGEKIDIDINSTSYNYSSYAFSYDYISRNYTEKYYDKKDYESSAAIAAMQIAEQSRDFSTSQLLVLGVNKSKSRTDQNEQSWDVYYQAY